MTALTIKWYAKMMKKTLYVDDGDGDDARRSTVVVVVVVFTVVVVDKNKSEVKKGIEMSQHNSPTERGI